MTRVYYKEAVGAFVVFDVTRVNTFEAVQKWKNDIDNKVTLPPDDRPIPVVLLANKVHPFPPPPHRSNHFTGADTSLQCDLAKEGFARNAAQMDKYCEEHGFAGWEETSAKENINIDKAVKFLVSKILENDINRQNQLQKKDENIVKVGAGGPEPKKVGSGGCCG
jgi:GTPase SAR1 family protein